MARLVWLIVLSGILFGQLDIAVKPAVSQESWQVSYINKLKATDNLSLAFRWDIFNINHSIDRYAWYRYTREDLSFVTQYSYFEIAEDAYSIKLGRDLLSTGPGKMTGLFLSPISPALDHVSFNLNEIYGFSITSTVIRLDNREIIWNGQNRVAQRWYYLRQVGYNYKNIVEAAVYDAVISTGYDRGLEWYYLNPLSSFFMERKNQMIWREGSDSTTVIGAGDNDNHFVGGSIKVNWDSLSVYSEILVDEWQLSSDHRPHMQTVFGLLLGVDYNLDKWDFAAEYSLASPWLYLNRALYGSPEYHGLPLGMRSPQSQCVDLFTQYSISGEKSLMLQIHLEQGGGQSLSTKWDGWDNKIDVFDFNKTLPAEFKLLFTDSNGKYFNTLGIYHNWLQSGTTQLMLGWNFRKTL